METTVTTSNKNTAALIHLSTLLQYMIPFSNYIFPVVIWSSLRDKSDYIDAQGKQAINFQVSLFLYSLLLALIAVPILLGTILQNVSFRDIFHGGDFQINELNFANLSGLVAVALIAAFLFFALKAAEFFLVIYASVKSANGENFKYPLTIPFIK